MFMREMAVGVPTVPLVRPLYALEDFCAAAVLLLAILLAGEPLRPEGIHPIHHMGLVWLHIPLLTRQRTVDIDPSGAQKLREG